MERTTQESFTFSLFLDDWLLQNSASEPALAPKHLSLSIPLDSGTSNNNNLFENLISEFTRNITSTPSRNIHRDQKGFSIWGCLSDEDPAEKNTLDSGQLRRALGGKQFGRLERKLGRMISRTPIAN